MIRSEQDRWRSLAERTVRASWKHLAESLVINGSLLAWFRWRRAPWQPLAFVTLAGVSLVIFNVLRIRGAMRALREPSRLRAFAEGQRRSHWVRGRVFLLGAPILVVFTWFDFLRETRAQPLDAWLVLAAGTLVIAWGIVVWWRALRRLEP